VTITLPRPSDLHLNNQSAFPSFHGCDPLRLFSQFRGCKGPFSSSNTIRFVEIASVSRYATKGNVPSLLIPPLILQQAWYSMLTPKMKFVQLSPRVSDTRRGFENADPTNPKVRAAAS
jgi:hypothetical protein